LHELRDGAGVGLRRISQIAKVEARAIGAGSLKKVAAGSPASMAGEVGWRWKLSSTPWSAPPV